MSDPVINWLAAAVRTLQLRLSQLEKKANATSSSAKMRISLVDALEHEGKTLSDQSWFSWNVAAPVWVPVLSSVEPNGDYTADPSASTTPSCLLPSSSIVLPSVPEPIWKQQTSSMHPLPEDIADKMNALSSSKFSACDSCWEVLPYLYGCDHVHYCWNCCRDVRPQVRVLHVRDAVRIKDGSDCDGLLGMIEALHDDGTFLVVGLRANGASLWRRSCCRSQLHWYDISSLKLDD